MSVMTGVAEERAFIERLLGGPRTGGDRLRAPKILRTVSSAVRWLACPPSAFLMTFIVGVD
jgi:hypothetical protein